VAFAPADDPKIAIAVIVENGEKSSKAALVAKLVVDRYLEMEAAEGQEIPLNIAVHTPATAREAITQ
jgi:cell division protein FtsI/penicillin-binding protein 2